ncbi:MAG: hypothetical protein LLG13_06880 [Bacteroidales bacterium]|nr:hypothetical protein [Bacteroidales bacterium]
MKKVYLLSLVFILATGFFMSCKKDKGDPPVLPPEGSMTIDFSNFVASSKSAAAFSDIKGINQINWEFSATVAGIWNTLLTTTLIVPVAAFKVATDQEPVYLSDKTWQWSYDVPVALTTYKARLTGQIRASDVLWQMHITKEGTGGYNEFLWFEGTSKLDGTSGQWILNQSAQVPEACLQIDWTKTSASIATIKYTYVKTSQPSTGSYIEYGLQVSGDYDAYYSIYYNNGNGFSTVDVKWNRTTHNGRVKCPEFFSDSNWYCWDSNLTNVICN